MKEIFTLEILYELAETGEIALSQAEAQKIYTEMNRQMAIIRQLESIPLDETLSPIIHGNPYPEDIRAYPREDEVIPFKHPSDILTQAPQHQDQFFVSPDLPHQKLD